MKVIKVTEKVEVQKVKVEINRRELLDLFAGAAAEEISCVNNQLFHDGEAEKAAVMCDVFFEFTAAVLERVDKKILKMKED